MALPFAPLLVTDSAQYRSFDTPVSTDEESRQFSFKKTISSEIFYIEAEKDAYIVGWRVVIRHNALCIKSITHIVNSQG